MPEALVLTPEAPYPHTGGGALRIASLLEYFAQRYTLDVITFREPQKPDPGAAFPAGIARHIHVIDLPYHRKDRTARIARNTARLARGVPPLVDRFAGFEQCVSAFLGGRRYDIAVIEHFWCAPYWTQLAPHAQRTVLDLIDIESILHGRCAGAERWPVAFAHQWFSNCYRKLEAQWFPHFDILLATSTSDAEQIRKISPNSRIIVYPNALPDTPLPRRIEENVVAFSGNLEFHPNVQAVRFFRAAIWPVLRERWPGLIWRLIGKNPEAVKKYTIGDPRIQVTGPIVNAVEELAAAKVVVAPLLAGSGTRLKIIEAWAAGRAVVSTRIGAEGLSACDGGNLLLADDASAFAESVSSVLQSKDLRERLGRAGRVLFDSEFTWSSAWSRLDL